CERTRDCYSRSLEFEPRPGYSYVLVGDFDVPRRSSADRCGQQQGGHERGQAEPCRVAHHQCLSCGGAQTAAPSLVARGGMANASAARNRRANTLAIMRIRETPFPRL